MFLFVSEFLSSRFFEFFVFFEFLKFFRFFEFFEFFEFLGSYFLWTGFEGEPTKRVGHV